MKASPHRRRLFFYGNAISDRVRSERDIRTDSPAATRKMVGLCRSLRAVKVPATIVSMGRGGGTRSGRWFPAHAGRLGGVPVVYGPVWDIPLVSQLLSAIWLMLVASRLARRHRTAVHLMYNQMSAYLPALAALRIRRASVAADIEDGPTKGNDVAYTRPLGTLSPKLFARFISDGALLATSALAKGTSIRPVKPYYGAVAPRDGAPPVRDFTGPGPLVALFAGYLNEDTGLTMLAGAVEQMRASADPLFANLTLKISGMGPGLEILRRFEQGAAPRLEILGRLDNAAYASLLDDIHIGLSLKPVGGEVSETTFPSKTVEYAENGLLLVATDISDVRALFGDTALYLERNDPGELVKQLRFALGDRAAAATLAERSRRLVDEQLAFPAAGRALADFLFSGARA